MLILFTMTTAYFMEYADFGDVPSPEFSVSIWTLEFRVMIGRKAKVWG